MKEIINYLPYRPTIEILNYKQDYVGIKTAKTTGFYFIGEDIYITYEGGSVGKKVGSECKLHLRPLSDLIEEIEHDGIKFIPLMRLFKNVCESSYVDYDGGFDNFHLQIDDDWNYCLIFKDESVNQMLEFNSFQGCSFALSCSSIDDPFNNFEWLSVEYQLDLFKLMHEWGFDMYEFIENGFALNINENKQQYDPS